MRCLSAQSYTKEAVRRRGGKQREVVGVKPLPAEEGRNTGRCQPRERRTALETAEGDYIDSSVKLNCSFIPLFNCASGGEHGRPLSKIIKSSEHSFECGWASRLKSSSSGAHCNSCDASAIFLPCTLQLYAGIEYCGFGIVGCPANNAQSCAYCSFFPAHHLHALNRPISLKADRRHRQKVQKFPHRTNLLYG